MLLWSHGRLAVVNIILPKPRTAKPIVEIIEGNEDDSLVFDRHDCEGR